MRRRQARLMPTKKLAMNGSPIKKEREAEIETKLETEIEDDLNTKNKSGDTIQNSAAESAKR